MGGRVDIFVKIWKKIEVTGPKKSTVFERFQSKLPKTMFFRSCDLIYNFFALLSKMCQSKSTLPVILSFMKFCVAGTFLVDDVLEVLLVVGLKL